MAFHSPHLDDYYLTPAGQAVAGFAVEQPHGRMQQPSSVVQLQQDLAYSQMEALGLAQHQEQQQQQRQKQQRLQQHPPQQQQQEHPHYHHSGEQPPSGLAAASALPAQHRQRPQQGERQHHQPYHHHQRPHQHFHHPPPPLPQLPQQPQPQQQQLFQMPSAPPQQPPFRSSTLQSEQVQDPALPLHQMLWRSLHDFQSDAAPDFPGLSQLLAEPSPGPLQAVVVSGGPGGAGGFARQQQHYPQSPRQRGQGQQQLHQQQWPQAGMPHQQQPSPSGQYHPLPAPPMPAQQEQQQFLMRLQPEQQRQQQQQQHGQLMPQLGAHHQQQQAGAYPGSPCGGALTTAVEEGTASAAAAAVAAAAAAVGMAVPPSYNVQGLSLMSQLPSYPAGMPAAAPANPAAAASLTHGGSAAFSAPSGETVTMVAAAVMENLERGQQYHRRVYDLLSYYVRSHTTPHREWPARGPGEERYQVVFAAPRITGGGMGSVTSTTGSSLRRCGYGNDAAVPPGAVAEAGVSRSPQVPGCGPASAAGPSGGTSPNDPRVMRLLLEARGKLNGNVIWSDGTPVARFYLAAPGELSFEEATQLLGAPPTREPVSPKGCHETVWTYTDGQLLVVGGGRASLPPPPPPSLSRSSAGAAAAAGATGLAAGGKRAADSEAVLIAEAAAPPAPASLDRRSRQWQLAVTQNAVYLFLEAVVMANTEVMGALLPRLPHLEGPPAGGGAGAEGRRVNWDRVHTPQERRSPLHLAVEHHSVWPPKTEASRTPSGFYDVPQLSIERRLGVVRWLLTHSDLPVPLPPSPRLLCAQSQPPQPQPPQLAPAHCSTPPGVQHQGDQVAGSQSEGWERRQQQLQHPQPPQTQQPQQQPQQQQQHGRKGGRQRGSRLGAAAPAPARMERAGRARAGRGGAGAAGAEQEAAGSGAGAGAGGIPEECTTVRRDVRQRWSSLMMQRNMNRSVPLMTLMRYADCDGQCWRPLVTELMSYMSYDDYCEVDSKKGWYPHHIASSRGSRPVGQDPPGSRSCLEELMSQLLRLVHEKAWAEAEAEASAAVERMSTGGCAGGGGAGGGGGKKRRKAGAASSGTGGTRHQSRPVPAVSSEAAAAVAVRARQLVCGLLFHLPSGHYDGRLLEEVAAARGFTVEPAGDTAPSFSFVLQQLSEDLATFGPPVGSGGGGGVGDNQRGGDGHEQGGSFAGCGSHNSVWNVMPGVMGIAEGAAALATPRGVHRGSVPGGAAAAASEPPGALAGALAGLEQQQEGMSDGRVELAEFGRLVLGSSTAALEEPESAAAAVGSRSGRRGAPGQGNGARGRGWDLRLRGRGVEVPGVRPHIGGLGPGGGGEGTLAGAFGEEAGGGGGGLEDEGGGNGGRGGQGRQECDRRGGRGRSGSSVAGQRG